VSEQGVNSSADRILRSTTVTQGRFQQMNYVRGLSCFATEGQLAPAAGQRAPTPSEALLAALGSCIAAGTEARAALHGITLNSMQVDVEADCDPSSAWGGLSVGSTKPVGFEVVRITVHIEADAPRAVLETLVTHVTISSPVANTVHDPVHLDVRLAWQAV
jgi:uncharacterized OsmC-like protein